MAEREQQDVENWPVDEAEVSEASAPTPIVGIGVCARSLRSLEELFGDLSPSLAAAYVVAVRQEEGLNVGTVLEVLQRRSSMPVSVAADGEAIEPNRIYVAGPNDLLTISDGHLAVRPADEPIGHRGTIDTMLTSLAEHAHERAIAIILAGLGNDGTTGVTATKKFGGLSIGECEKDDADEARGASGPMGVVDLHLPIHRIPGQVRLYLANLSAVTEPSGDGEDADQLETQIGQVTTILRNATGHDFHGYKRGTFLRRVHRRLQVLQIEDLGHYVERLRSDGEEVRDLFQDLLIGVTQFFRDPAEFDVLEADIPRLFENKGPEDQFRVWVLGCATGEEAYSIAILLREHMATLPYPPQVQIFATDLDSRALGLARAGRYAETIAYHVRPDRLERWFVREGDTYCVSKELREMCIFSPHNVIKDAPFSRVDILSCRNLLIYLNADLQDRVMPIFHFSLRHGGVLFLGSSENITRHQKLFAPIDRKSRVFRRVETMTRIVPDFPLSPRTRRPEPIDFLQTTKPAPARLNGGLNRQVDALAERYTPAYVVVDHHGDVLHFSGRTGRFLEPVSGVASLNLLNLVHRDLRSDLRSALQRAAADGQRIELRKLTIEQEDRVIGLNLIVEPVGPADIRSLVVFFQDLGVATEPLDGDDRLAGNEHVERLEAELRLTRDRLQATIEELESTNEELKSSNEEYQSINEELQSANEEMETSKEELQSVNEELQTVNGELAHRVTELGHSNSDLKNLLEATQIATMFLDNDLRVRSFTPSVTEVFHLLDTDVGRPLDHVVSRIAYPELQDDVRRVLKSLTPVERIVIDPTTQRHLAARVLPYRSLDNYISGAVVTFTDLTAVHQAESALRDSERRLQALLTASVQITYRMSADWSEMLEMVGKGFLADTLRSETWLEQHIPDAEQPRVKEAIENAIRSKRVFELEHRVRRVDGSIGWTISRAVPIIEDGEIVEWFGAASDNTAEREAEDALKHSEERLHSLVEGLSQLVWRAVGDGDATWASRQWAEFTGQNEQESAGLGWLDVVHPDDRDSVRAAWRHAGERGAFDIEFRIRRAADGCFRWFQTKATPIRDDSGGISEWIGTSTDIHDLRELRERQTVLVAELQHRTRNLIAVVRQMVQRTIVRSHDLDDFWQRFHNRLEALARVQGLLSRLNDHDRVMFDELLWNELSAHGVEAERDGKVQLSGPADVRLRSSTVQTLAMALHELATNAAKYGALVQPDAHLTITWRLEQPAGDGQPWLHIDWQETGVSMPPAGATAQGSGQGRELIERALPYQLSGKTTYVLDTDGVKCTIAIRVSSTTGREGESG